MQRKVGLEVHLMIINMHSKANQINSQNIRWFPTQLTAKTSGNLHQH